VPMSGENGFVPALTPCITLTRARAFPKFSVPALMARPWSARCYGVARQREGSRQNSRGVSGVLSLRHFGLARGCRSVALTHVCS
jgi:hypothetical protein